jgi:hypothetical protein
MSDTRDPLEDELAGFSPRPIAASLRDRIGRQLTVERQRRRQRIVFGLAAAVVAAACVWWLFPQTPPSDDRVEPVVNTPRFSVANESPPTLANYRRALNQSPEALEQLLDHQATVTCRAEQSSAVMSVVHRDEVMLVQ